MSGTESEVAGIISATINMKTVRERRTVIPKGRNQNKINARVYLVKQCIVFCA